MSAAPTATSRGALADRLSVVVGQALAGAATVMAGASWFLLHDTLIPAVAGMALVNSLSLWRAGSTGQGGRLALAHLALYGGLGALLYGVVPVGFVAWGLHGLLVLLAALIGGERAVGRMAGLLVLLHVLATFTRSQVVHPPTAELALGSIAPPVVILLVAAVSIQLLRREDERLRLLTARLEEIEAVIPATRSIAGGDLQAAVQGEGALADAVRTMKKDLRTLVSELQTNTSTLKSAAGAVQDTAASQRASTSKLLDAVEEIREAQVRLDASARGVADAARSVADASAMSKAGAETMSDRLDVLVRHAARVRRLLSAIKVIANKSEVLAVNASIEAVHAGESGRAFSLVAGNLQALAESVKQELVQVERLNADVQAAAGAAQDAAKNSTRHIQRNVHMADQIKAHSADQVEFTAGFADAVDTIEDFVRRSATEAEQVEDHVTRVVDVADVLSSHIQRFRT